jgi:hypothetical protein
MAKAIARVATELAKRKARSAGKFPKGKKGSKAVDARTSRYIKTPSGMKLNPERFKQLPKASKLKQTKATKKPGFNFGVAAGSCGNRCCCIKRFRHEKSKRQKNRQLNKWLMKLTKNKRKDKKSIDKRRVERVIDSEMEVRRTSRL